MGITGAIVVLRAVVVVWRVTLTVVAVALGVVVVVMVVIVVGDATSWPRISPEGYVDVWTLKYSNPAFKYPMMVLLMTMSCFRLVVAFKLKRSAAADVLFAGPWM